MTGNLRDAIRAAFDAGCEQGSDEATAHEWGRSPQQSRDEAFTDFMAEWNPDSAAIRAAMTPTHRSDDMTDKLRVVLEAADALAEQAHHVALGASVPQLNIHEAASHLGPLWRKYHDARAALAAAPQPAPDRETLVEVIESARERSTSSYAIADALLARGLRLPGGAEAERDAAFAAGQEEMRERAAEAVIYLGRMKEMRGCGVDGPEVAHLIRALPIKDRAE